MAKVIHWDLTKLERSIAVLDVIHGKEELTVVTPSGRLTFSDQRAVDEYVEKLAKRPNQEHTLN